MNGDIGRDVRDWRTQPKIHTSVTVNRADGSTFQDVASPTRSEILEGSLDGVESLATLKYPPVGHCIYCSSVEALSREHIVPFDLNGNAVLPSASCAGCRKITSTFEGKVLRGSIRAVRVLCKLQSRNKRDSAPTVERLEFIRNGVMEMTDLPIEKFPILLPFPTFAPLRFLTGDQKSGIDITGVVTISFGRRPELVARELGAQQLVLRSKPDDAAAFARMIAKIGYAMAFALGDLNRLDGPSPIIPSILGKVNDIGRWVGTLGGPIRRYPGLLHRIEIHEDREHQLLLAEVQLFSNSETPSYRVILGHLKESTAA